jgi:hypothetical protein
MSTSSDPSRSKIIDLSPLMSSRGLRLLAQPSP